MAEAAPTASTKAAAVVVAVAVVAAAAALLGLHGGLSVEKKQPGPVQCSGSGISLFKYLDPDPESRRKRKTEDKQGFLKLLGKSGASLLDLFLIFLVFGSS